MSFNASQITEDFSCAPQITVEEIDQIARMGFKSVMNCRPDGEGGADQPASDQLKAAAERHGLHYLHVPVEMGSDINAIANHCKAVIEHAPKPMLGFCKSGMRARTLYQACLTVPTPKSPWQWLKSKCIFTRLWRWVSNRKHSSCGA